MKYIYHIYQIVRNIVLTVACCIVLSACSSSRVEIVPNFSLKDKDELSFAEEQEIIKPKGYNSSNTIKSKNRTFASVKFYMTEDADEKPIVVDLKRHDRAYLAETTLYQQDKMATYFSVGMDKDSKFVAGLRMRWNF
jgi:hypothetical protein